MATKTAAEKPSAFRRLADAMKALGPHVDKVAKNPHFKSGYCPLPVLMEVVRPVLEEHDLILTQPLFATNVGQVGVGTSILDAETGEVLISSEFSIPCDQSNPQKATAAVTYARRTGITSILGIAEADDDGNSAAPDTPKRDAAGAEGGGSRKDLW